MVPLQHDVSEHFHWLTVSTMALIPLLRREQATHMLYTSSTPGKATTLTHYMAGSAFLITEADGAVFGKSLARDDVHVIQAGCCWDDLFTSNCLLELPWDFFTIQTWNISSFILSCVDWMETKLPLASMVQNCEYYSRQFLCCSRCMQLWPKYNPILHLFVQRINHVRLRDHPSKQHLWLLQLCCTVSI